VRIGLNRSALRELRPVELAWRFVLGGAITAGASLIAKRYGPSIGGLFLAFPAILPASLTLVAKHQEQRKRERGLRGVVRGRHAAALDAFGALMGTAGLIAFAATTWIAAPRIAAPLALIAASVMWLAIATGLWRLRKC
jgi:uncharacterized protein DUF3147